MRAYALSYPVNVPDRLNADVTDFGGEVRPVQGGTLLAYAIVELGETASMAELEELGLYCPELLSAMEVEARWISRSFLSSGNDWSLLSAMAEDACARLSLDPDRLAERIGFVLVAARGTWNDVPSDAELGAHGIPVPQPSAADAVAFRLARTWRATRCDNDVLRRLVSLVARHLDMDPSRLSVRVHESLRPSRAPLALIRTGAFA